MEHPHGEIFVAMSSHEANSVMLLMELMSRFLSGVFSMTSQATSEVRGSPRLTKFSYEGLGSRFGACGNFAGFKHSL